MPGRARATVVSPKQLGAYHQCPLKHHFQFRRKLRGTFSVTPHLAEGNALHLVMKRWFRTRSDWRAGADPAVVHRWAEEALVADHYDAPTDHRQAQRTVAERAAWCLGQIPADVTVRWSERELQTDAVRIGDHPVRFQSRIDLVVEHPDGEIEHIDFKSGGPQEDHWIQRGVERLVVGAMHPVASDRLPTRTTTLYAGARQVDSRAHSPETFRATRFELRDLTQRMLTDDTPEPTPSGRCGWCPFRDAGCPAGNMATTAPAVERVLLVR